jgi:hypothetical protein
VQEEDTQNRQLLDLSGQILELTRAVHAYARAARPDLVSDDVPLARAESAAPDGSPNGR